MIREQIAKLINLKTIMTLCVVATFMYLSAKGFFTNEQVYTIVYATFATFLGYQLQKSGR